MFVQLDLQAREYMEYVCVHWQFAKSLHKMVEMAGW